MTNVEIIMVPYNYDHNNFNFIDETKKSRDDHENVLLNLVHSKICQKYTTIKLP